MRSKEISHRRDNTRDTVSLGTASKMEIWERTFGAKHARGIGCTLTPFRSGVVVISGAHVRQWSRNDEDVGGS